MAHVTVAIASCGRKSLADTLASLDRQITPAGWQVHLVVADDSLDGSATRLVSRAKLPWPVQVINVASRNVAVARNACLDVAEGEYIAFIDDDEIAGPHWISEFVNEAIRTNADCLFAPVEPRYAPGTPAWIVHLNPLFPEEVRTATQGDVIIGRTGNSLLRRSFIERNKLRFDSSFGGGGEDLHFFALCRKYNAVMVTTDVAAVQETVAPHRTGLCYVLRACFSRGKGYARVMAMTGQQGFARGARMALASFVKMLVCSVLAFVALPLGQFRWVRFAGSAASNLGKVAYLMRGGEAGGAR